MLTYTYSNTQRPPYIIGSMSSHQHTSSQALRWRIFMCEEIRATVYVCSVESTRAALVVVFRDTGPLVPLASASPSASCPTARSCGWPCKESDVDSNY